MPKVVLTCLLLIIGVTAIAQVRVGRLVVKKGQTYELGNSDILVADTLIMMDSSRLVLNRLKRENFIRVKVAIFGNHTTIDGHGVHGTVGVNGKRGTTGSGPCQNGTPGKNGTRGLDGGTGLHLFLYIDKITAKGRLKIDLSGGNGGNGGDGAEGGGGSPGTNHCFGGNGGNGGNGANGGNGGEGGTLTVGGADLAVFKALLGNNVLIMNQGGNFGYHGISGPGGPPGLGPMKKNGRAGIRGFDGGNGKSGNNGTIKFEEN